MMYNLDRLLSPGIPSITTDWSKIWSPLDNTADGLMKYVNIFLPDRWNGQ